MAEYMLIDITPDGKEKSRGPFANRGRAAMFAGLSLYDNGRASKVGAQRFSAELSRVPIGTAHAHESGYAFRIERAS